MDFDDFELDPFSFPEFKNESNDLQRTKEWLEARRGNFTGSRMGLLMGCGRSTSKLLWGSVDKLIDFSVTAEKYIYNVGKERTTGLLSQHITSKQMNHGKIYEPLLIQKLLDENIITSFKESGFEKLENHNGGASPDGKIIYQGEEMGLETKCCVSWDGHFKRMYDKVHDKHDDFWQFQAEMLSLKVDKLLYVVAAPMTIQQYDIQVIEASKTHQKAMVNRIVIADKAISYWGKHGYVNGLKLACAEWEDEEDKES